jgi:hypothetical protein
VRITVDTSSIKEDEDARVTDDELRGEGRQETTRRLPIETWGNPLWWAFWVLERLDQWKIPAGPWRTQLHRDPWRILREMESAMMGPLMIACGPTFLLAAPLIFFGSKVSGVGRASLAFVGFTVGSLPVAAMSVMLAWHSAYRWKHRKKWPELRASSLESLIRRSWRATWPVAIFGAVVATGTFLR